MNQAGLRVAQYAGLQQHLDNGRVVGQHGEYRLSPERLRRIGCHLDSINPRITGAVPCANLVARLDQVARHGAPHGAKTDKADFHYGPPCNAAAPACRSSQASTGCSAASEFFS